MAIASLNVLDHVPARARGMVRGPEDDFFCIRYEIWYPSHDCAIRTKFRTAAGCLDCEQGRFNLKRHHASMRFVRDRFPRCD